MLLVAEWNTTIMLMEPMRPAIINRLVLAVAVEIRELGKVAVAVGSRVPGGRELGPMLLQAKVTITSTGWMCLTSRGRDKSDIGAPRPVACLTSRTRSSEIDSRNSSNSNKAVVADRIPDIERRSAAGPRNNRTALELLEPELMSRNAVCYEPCAVVGIAELFANVIGMVRASRPNCETANNALAMRSV